MTSKIQGRRLATLVTVAAGAWIALGAQGCKPSVPAQIRYGAYAV